jgi:hypothetical protein
VKTEHTLRYLLLRHLERFEAAVPRERFFEITRSLRVEVQARTAYSVSYRDGGRLHEQSFPFDAFRFYERGDTRPGARSIEDDLENENDELARRFAEQVFGIDVGSLPVAPTEPLEAHRGAAIAEMAAFAGATAWLAGLDAGGWVALLGLTLLEFAPSGRLISSALWCLVAATSPTSAALLGALAYGALQLLDPNPDRRLVRSALCGGAVVLASARLWLGPEATDWGVAALAAVAVATGLAAVRSFYSSHFRALALALPFYCAGLVADQDLMAALVGAFVLVAGTAFTAVGHRWFPIQRSRV